MTLAPPETTTSDDYTVSAEMLRERIGCERHTLANYQKEGRKLIPRGKRRPGVRGLFFTKAQANKLMTRLGSKAERFDEFS